jgi:hypothetical protein
MAYTLPAKPNLLISSAVARHASIFRDAIKTSAPAATIAVVAIRPMPVAPPVTRAVFPFNPKSAVGVMFIPFVSKTMKKQSNMV